MPVGSPPHSRLSDDHLKLLTNSAISEEVRVARGYRSIQRPIDLQEFGFGRDQRRHAPGLFIPLFDVEGGCHFQYRPDHPRHSNGKAVRYELPLKARFVIDVLPAIRERVLDPATPLYITEGI